MPSHFLPSPAGGRVRDDASVRLTTVRGRVSSKTVVFIAAVLALSLSRALHALEIICLSCRERETEMGETERASV